MKHYLPYFFLVVLSFLSLSSLGQVTVEYPTDRSVFQRDKNNSATIYISGTYTKIVDRIEAKLSPINGQGTDKDWKTIATNPKGGFFSERLDDAKGGWYTLEVRAWKGDQMVGSYTVPHVGVGEVFLIAGQSNSQGYKDMGARGAQDDRVNCIRYNNTDAPRLYEDLPYPHFEHLDADSEIAPRGYSSWAWGKLGDNLAARLNVPILFYNVGWYGTAVRTWRESINGTGYSVYTGVPIEPSGMPYKNMRAVIQRYTPITGLRGVLWLQGEADNDVSTSTDSYAQDLKTVIEASRNESGKNISWVVSLTSYNNRKGSNQRVIEGQRKVINTVNNVFEGPSTDNIQIPRIDQEGVHFKDDGLVQLGDAWTQQLSDDFFSRSEPYQGVSPMKISATCAGDGSINLNADTGGLNSFSWNNGQNSSSVRVGNGSYRAFARDDRGFYIFSPEIKVYESIQPNRPTISLEGSNPVCLGNTATLISSTSENIRWSTGSTSDRLPVTVGGEYFVTTQNVYGCEATSDKITMKVVTSPLPDKPKITASGVLTFCDGGEVKLTSDSKVKNVWSTGDENASITVKNSGDYTVRALDNAGCYSPASDVVAVKVNPLPAKPEIAVGGATTFCAGENVTLTSNYDTGNIWSNAATTKAISITISGNFSLKQRDANGCESTSDVIAVKVNPLPATPTITAVRPTTFCDRDFTTLRSSEAFSYVWSNGNNNREIEIRESGDFTIAARDENGCVSPVSPVTKVVKNPLPATPVITADGPTTFCADLSVNLRSTAAAGFLWSNGAATQTLKVTTAGNYSVQTINEFKCYSDPSNRIETTTLALPPAPIVKALSATTFCDGDTITLQATNGDLFFWNNGEEGENISVFESGTFSARIKDGAGCFSPYSPEIAIDVKPSPSVPQIRQIGPFTLLAENNLSEGDHVWKLNENVLTENSGILKAVRSGSYVVNNTIVYSPTLTCFSDFSAPFSFFLDTTNPGFVAFPNPNSTGKLTVETLTNVTNAEVQVIDSRGVIHKTFKVAKFDRQHFFNLSGLSSGIYIVRILSTTFTASQKLIIVQ
ncbi:sialate O-acetylesterase [Dyadobacter sp. CY343]|uniref:T9SS type A sorting domain-containing protein n=1 Tax=Dyadobacter sp. CY343 TaxID=2907299 RepID=UPI001F462B8B|nr:sialate O-acetylesterase [Dyadobacter sp. CY343]MCE7062489.1 T9SS type A sorting domain-containing protein [Dyadobacter sp. CY343]